VKILLIEDDERLVWSIKTRMEKDGYVLDFETDGQAGEDAALTGAYDLLILDIMLPTKDGFTICRNIRKNGIKTPILILTARYRETDKVLGLDCGADDYLAKPFGYPELYARVRALIRRSYDHPTADIAIGQLYIDTCKKTVLYKGEEVSLTSKEYAIIEYLALNRNGVITRQMIEEHIWNSDSNAFSNVVEVLMSRIRKKLDPADKEAVIGTVKGLGYIIREKRA
jgi:DNA-binding response OmpR family regulator